MVSGIGKGLIPRLCGLMQGAVAVQEHELVCVSTDIVKTSSCAEVKVSFTKIDRADEEAGAWDWVQCPICRKSIQGTDSAINNHVGELTDFPLGFSLLCIHSKPL